MRGSWTLRAHNRSGVLTSEPSAIRSQLMRTMRKTTALVLLAVGIVLFGPAPQVQATLVLEGTLTPSGGSPTTIWATDNNVAYPGAAPAGSIQLLDTSGTVGTLALAPGA